ncbi:hypothetical protein ETH_00037880 [Eimeria tenella]|uniref:Uncharacterized protein n=1 Tax=Eimeria tenella TaxID=5802 RepID=U6L315_EIMTE|nr:hypothetical protein ETH_00037880 [Eimeria tenella]CDJ44797.1 hypothetical protein ETH_00037880 [Eimeria tenella]|eukprot:XP_013235545.1 hypothetical protein ETH_00037880 [Eimeria tenella]
MILIKHLAARTESSSSSGSSSSALCVRRSKKILYLDSLRSDEDAVK